MSSRQNLLADLAADTHFEVDKKAYEALTKITDLAGTLPGNSSTASPVENVGMCTSNVVQTQIQFGVAGLSLRDVKNIVDGILDATYVGVNYTTREVVNDPSGAALTIDGPGGRSSESLKSPLRLSIETFRHLSTSKGDAVSFFLPENTTVMQLDITVSVQTQYTSDQDAVTVAAKDVIADSASKISTDLQYHALKVDPVIGNMFLDLMHGNDYGEPDWLISTVAPAATDASFVQRAELDSATHALIGVKRVVLHSNFGTCSDSGICPFNHKPLFREVSGRDLAYDRTEVVARALAHLAVEILAEPKIMDQVTNLAQK